MVKLVITFVNLRILAGWRFCSIP